MKTLTDDARQAEVQPKSDPDGDRALGLDQTKRFLRMMLPDDVPPDRPAMLRMLNVDMKPSDAFPFASRNEAAKLFLQERPREFADHNVFFGSYLLPDGWEQRSPVSHGREDEISDVLAIVADLDAQSPFRSEPHQYPETKNDVLKLVPQIPLPPTILIDSGGGLQAVWLFDEPVDVRDDDRRQYMKQLVRRWHEVLNQIWTAAGHPNGVDRKTSLNQLIRVPGTYNLKSLGSDAPEGALDEWGTPMVTLVDGHCGPARRYTVGDFERAVGEPEASVAEQSEPAALAPDGPVDYLQRVDTVTPASDDPDRHLRLLMGAQQGGRNSALTSLAGRWFHLGMREDEVIAHATVWNRQNTPPLVDGELLKTVRSVQSYHASDSHDRHDWLSGVRTHGQLHGMSDEPQPMLFVDASGKPLIQAHRLLGIHGWWRCGKSYLVQAMMCAHVTGTSWLDAFPSACDPRPVLYIQEDDSYHDVRDRLDQLVRMQGLDPYGSDYDPELIRVMCHRGFRIDDRDWQTRITDYIGEDAVGLVVIDPLAKCHQANENDASDMTGRVVMPLQRISVDTGATVIMVHHDTKAGPPNGRRDIAWRGSGAVPSAASIISVGSKRQPWGLEATLTFNPKGIPCPDPVTVEMRLDPSEPLRFTARAPDLPDSNARRIMAFIRSEGPATTKEVEAGTSLSYDQIRSAADRLVGRGHLVKKKDGSRNVFSIPDDAIEMAAE